MIMNNEVGHTSMLRGLTGSIVTYCLRNSLNSRRRMKRTGEEEERRRIRFRCTGHFILFSFFRIKSTNAYKKRIILTIPTKDSKTLFQLDQTEHLLFTS
jgi:hypothetical protein